MQLEFMADEPVGDRQLFVYLDAEGEDLLVRSIEAAKRGDHQHLLTDQWGGSGLTATSGSTRIFKVTLTFARTPKVSFPPKADTRGHYWPSLAVG